jgi:YggT family protein
VSILPPIATTLEGAVLNPFIELISSIISIFSTILLIWVILSLLIHFDIINRYNPLVAKIFGVLTQIVDPALRPFRRLQWRLLPRVQVDLSPIFLILAMEFIRSALFHWFYEI